MTVLDLYRSRLTFDELRNMPNRYFHTLYYKNYLANSSKRAAKATAERQVVEQIEDEMH